MPHSAFRRIEMLPMKIKLAALGLVAAASLGGCVDDYGYGGLAVGYGNVGYGGGGYYDGYGDGYYGDGYGGYPAGYYGGGSYGWFGDYYYPGTGYYVYGRDRRPYRWNDEQRYYWEGRRGDHRTTGDGQGRANWQGFDHDRGRPGQGQGYRGQTYQDQRGQGQSERGGRPEWRGNREAVQQGQAVQPQIQRDNRPSAGQRTFQGRPQGGNSGRGGGRRGRD
jgi:hypothetical protein